MSIQNYSLINSNSSGKNVAFRAEEPSKIPMITKPIDKVESIVNNTVDTFVPESKTEESKNTRKTAIRVGSTVLVLSAIVALLNPKFSSTLVNKLKTKSTKATNKANVDNSIVGLWNKLKAKCLNGTSNLIQIVNNGNSIKDELFQKLCNKTSFTKAIHRNITKGFDKISKQTVYRTHKTVSKQMNILDDIMKNYKDRLSDSEKMIFEQKLAEIDNVQKYYGRTQTEARLKIQADKMQNLESEVSSKITQAKDTIVGRIKGNKIQDELKFKDTYKFWAEEAILPERNLLEENGQKVVESLVGDSKTKKGLYGEVVDILAPRLNQQEKTALEESIKHTKKLLNKANKTECIEYFDKKRDLILGSAPTDILTAVASLIASGIAIGIADSREDRISRLISGAMPVVAGFGVSTLLTMMLFSGGKGIALGALSSMGLSAIGSGVSHRLFPKKSSEMLIAENANNNKSEVKDA